MANLRKVWHTGILTGDENADSRGNFCLKDNKF
jgi:hypothetical protein